MLRPSVQAPARRALARPSYLGRRRGIDSVGWFQRRGERNLASSDGAGALRRVATGHILRTARAG